VFDLDAVVQPAKETREHELTGAHDRIAEVGRDLPRKRRALSSAAAIGTPRRRDSSAIAFCNSSDATIDRIRLRRCDRSGPIADSRIRRKWKRR
jgi:hypothetical protein